MNEAQRTVLSVRDLKKHFTIKSSSSLKLGSSPRITKAVDGVSFDLKQNETYGLVGESGCGKSTTGRSILRLMEPTSGSVIYDDVDLLSLKKHELRQTRRNLQMIFQDPFSSLNPKKRVGAALTEPLEIHNIGSRNERVDHVMEALHTVGLAEDHYYRFPHEFSGGQKQRIGIARALIADPTVVVCDEAVSALDVSVQAQILNLLKKLQVERHLSYLFISHDMAVVRHIADRVGVMYLGHIVEEGPTASVFENPAHPYTKALLSAVPHPEPGHKNERIVLQGEPPSATNPPQGCVFNQRCPFAMEVCFEQAPEQKAVEEGHQTACHLY